METRRYILAIGLSMLVLLTYFRFFAPQPVEQAPPEAPQTAPGKRRRKKRRLPSRRGLPVWLRSFPLPQRAGTS